MTKYHTVVHAMSHFEAIQRVKIVILSNTEKTNIL